MFTLILILIFFAVGLGCWILARVDNSYVNHDVTYSTEENGAYEKQSRLKESP